MTNQLTSLERTELQAYEKTIESTQGAFVACGHALGCIRDGKLYRASHRSFETYCTEKWGWTHRRANQLIEAAGVVDSVKNGNHGSQISNERQARALLPVPPEKRNDVMARISGPITASKIERAAKTIELDKTGWPIPKEIMEDWKRAEEAQELLSLISRVRCSLKESLDDNDPIYSEVTTSTLADLNNAYTSLKCVLPFAVCSTCQGHQKEKCILCKKRGFISEFRWNQCVPSEIKAVRAKGKNK